MNPVNLSRWLSRWLPRSHLPWPLPALAAWGLAWGLYLGLHAVSPLLATSAGLLLSAAMAWAGAWAGADSSWRRGLMAGGFPLSLALSGPASPLWLLPLALLLVIYPVQAWRDAPMFPTPAAALEGLADATHLAPGARVLDAGCGLGHGLRALQSALPGARIEGIERSWPLAGLALWRCGGVGPHAVKIRQGDMWRLGWQGYGLVYLFQRPESMARAMAKAEAEMAPGAWLASLEFEVPGRVPDASLRHLAGKPVWLYRVGSAGASRSLCPIGIQSAGQAADKPSECRSPWARAAHLG